MTRTNLTVLLEKGFEDLPGFFAENGVEVVASLPYYLKETVDRQRGQGVFDRSIEAIKRLNAVGYGREGSGLKLNLVYNPCGAYLPPGQRSIEADFKRELAKRHGVSFTGLFTITNMPVGRFRDFLEGSGNLARYMERLTGLFNPEAARNVMCRTTISVGHDGSLYDCDFNQMIGLKCGFGAPDHISRFDASALGQRRIVTGPHCYGCTAGPGSSCTGSVA
jgi:radical SAM/Cys-rich protein